MGGPRNGCREVQPGLNNLATALTAALVFSLNWGKYADATVLTVYLCFQTVSGINHGITAVTEKKYSRTNLMRPLLSLVLPAALVPHITAALG